MSKRPTVLVVDDDSPVLMTTAALLSDHYEVLTAASGEEAWTLLQEHEEVTVVCTDFNMPGISGIELLARLPMLGRPTSGVLLTAYQEMVPREDRATERPFLMLFKPYRPEKLLETVQAAERFNHFDRLLQPGPRG